MQARTLKQFAKRTGGGSIAVALLTLVCYRTHFDFASAIPVYMLLVVLQSLTGDFASAAVISVLSAICLDFFFAKPLFTLYMRNPLNVLALLAFLFTAMVVTTLVSRVRQEARSSELHKNRLDRLYQLSQQLLALDPEAAMGEKLLDPLHQLFGITAVCIFNAATAELQISGHSQLGLADKTRDAYITGHDLDAPGSALSVRCLRAGGKTTGAVGFEGLHEPSATSDSLAALTALLMERTNTFRTASSAAAATQAEVYRSAMLDALAHEFKTPLATILAAAGALRETGPLGSAQLEMTDTVENEAARLGSLTSRLLRTARLDREEIRPRMEMIDLTSLLTDVAERYSARSRDRRIVLTNRESVEVFADPELLRLTLNQLIENACKYSQPGSTVTVAIDRQDNFTTVRVSNNGSSIPFNERTRIFERFFRGAEAKRSTSGSGLGLYVARKIALAHGGALDLATEDQTNDGATFFLKIPNKKDELNHVIAAV